jgi:two-component system sensor histidine kinase/response regulator
MDGFQATAEIRALGASSQRELPVVALTAYAEVGYDKRCRDAGMEFYVSKPIDRAQLRAVLARIASGPAATDPPVRSVESPSQPESAAVGVSGRPPGDALTPAPTVPADEAALLELLDGDRNLFRELAELFLEEAPKHRSQLREALDRLDDAALRRTLHALKGAAGNFGAQEVQDAADAFGAFVRSGQLRQPGGRERATGWIETIETSLQDLCGRLRQIVRCPGMDDKDMAARRV